jgi:hypothetical protein
LGFLPTDRSVAFDLTIVSLKFNPKMVGVPP